jgi:hypothetical protein
MKYRILIKHPNINKDNWYYPIFSFDYCSNSIKEIKQMFHSKFKLVESGFNIRIVKW